MKTRFILASLLICGTLTGIQLQVRAQTIQLNSAIHKDPVTVKVQEQWPVYKLIDTATMTKGRLIFELPKGSQAVYSIGIKKPFVSVRFFSDTPIVTIHILQDSSVEVQGGVLLGHLGEFEASLQPLEKRWFKLGQRYEKTQDMEEKLRINKMTGQIAGKVEQKRLDYALNNKDNIAGAWVAYNYIFAWRTDALQRLLKAFEGKDWAAATYNGLVKKQQELASHSMKGTKAPSFTLSALDGNQVTLDSITAHHKYVVLDFWASWCAPCRATNRRFAPLYEAYRKKGIEFVSVSVDTDEQAWIQATKSDKIPWLQLRDASGFQGGLVKDYKIQALPSTFLINRNGMVVGQNLTKDDLDKL